MSAVTDAVLEPRRAEPRAGGDYAIVFFDALRVKIRNEGMVHYQLLQLGDKARNCAIADQSLSRTSPTFALLGDDMRITAIVCRQNLMDKLAKDLRENQAHRS